MNDNNFTKAVEFTGRWEWGHDKDGGYTDDPVDPGGETKWGISKRAHPDEDIQNMTFERALEIYWEEYWKPAKCDQYGLPMAVCIFDTAVNCGVDRALSFIPAEGITFKDYLAKRINFYAGLVKKKPAMSRFYRGWINRVVDLRKYAEILNNAD